MSIELAWCAGFYDGEGHFGKNGAGTDVVLRINQCHREPLDRFRQAIGVGKVYGPYGPYERTNKSPYFSFMALGDDARKAGTLIRPYLCSKKIEQLDAITAVET